MIDEPANYLQAFRPKVGARLAIVHCLRMLYVDGTNTLRNEVVPGLSFEELLGALLLALDLADLAEMDGQTRDPAPPPGRYFAR